MLLFSVNFMLLIFVFFLSYRCSLKKSMFSEVDFVKKVKVIYGMSSNHSRVYV